MSAQTDSASSAQAQSELRLQVRLSGLDEPAARELAAQLIDRAHELVNAPERECDLDVDVQWHPPTPRA